MMSGYFLGPLSTEEGIEENLYAELPFVVSLETTRSVTESGSIEDAKIYQFATSKEAFDFKTTRCDPDKAPEKCVVFGFSAGRWVKIDCVAENPN